MQRPAIRQRDPRSWLRRLRSLAARLGGVPAKSQRVYLVDVGGRRFKRVIQPDSHAAARVATSLTRLSGCDRVPALVAEYERELWVEFIPGARPGPVDAALARRVADFFADLYAREPRLVPLEDTPFAGRLQRNLRFLGEVGVLDADLRGDLERAAARLRPKEVWVGFDYTDAVLKNFVAAEDDGRICAVDVESLAADELMGVGVAKAAERWLGPHRDAFLDHLWRPGVPDLRPVLPFVELHFLAHWTARAFLERKWRFVDAARFGRFRGAERGP